MGQRIGGGGRVEKCVVTSVASFLVLGGGGARSQNIPTKIYIYCASERLRNIFSGLKIHMPIHNTINAFSFNYGMAL